MSSNIILGLVLAAVVSAGAVRAHALTVSGGILAALLGTLVFTSGGPTWSLPLLTFFVTSSLLSRRPRGNPSSSTRDRRSGPRTARQVVANGSAPALWATCQFIFPGHAWAVLFGSAVAAAAADTWATEIGRRSRETPRDLLSGRPVPTGTSGAITALGSAAALVGSASVGLVCLLATVLQPHEVPAVTMAGFGGSLADSLLGSSLQEVRWCPTCSLETEERIHARCLSPTIYQRGFPGLDNDWVNLIAGFAGSALGLLIMPWG